jgi:hypothetical protein
MICSQCNKELFWSGKKPKKFCSTSCSSKHFQEIKRKKNELIRKANRVKTNCLVCSKKFETNKKQPSNFCSNKCRNYYYYNPDNPENTERVNKKRKTGIYHGKIKQKKIEDAREAKGLPRKRKRILNTVEERKNAKKEALIKYLKTEKGVAAKKEYNQRAYVKVKKNEATKAYYKTEIGAKKRKIYYTKLYEEKGEELKAVARTPKGRAKTLARYHKRIKVDVVYKMTRALRSRLTSAVKAYKQNGIVFKKGKTLKMIGCSMEFFLVHMESQFKPGMSWDNHGLQSYKTGKKWNIDHIKAIDKFDLTKIEEQNKCFHYSNLQPLWHKENREKWYY